jgi:hypothetical protein
MRRLLIAAGLVLATLGNAAASDDDIVFAKKNYIDLGGESVGMSGTLVGDDLAYKNNTRSIFCMKERKECYATAIEQIGDKQIGRMDYVMIYPITKWTAAEIVAAEELSDFGCSRTTITITRKTESALWVEEPVNQARPQCQKSYGKVRKFTIEDSPGWAKIFGKKK